MEVYKVLIQEITESDKNQIVTAIGRAGEEINSRASFQHVGFHSTPKAGSIGFLVADGENLTMIASSDTSDDRPDSLEDTTTIYRDADKYIKIDDSGDITIANSNNVIILKGNGDIELGSGTLKKLVTEDILTALPLHTHTTSSPGAPTGTATFVPALSTALHCTTKTSAE